MVMTQMVVIVLVVELRVIFAWLLVSKAQARKAVLQFLHRQWWCYMHRVEDDDSDGNDDDWPDQ
jgi:hypothetical protein